MRHLLVILAALALASTASAHVDRVDIPNAWQPPCHGEEVPEPGECSTFFGHGHADILDDGSKGEDRVWMRGGNDKAWLLRAPDHWYGGKGADKVWMGSGHDHGWGGAGDDRIDCGEGGGNPTDVARGGDGADTFVDCEVVTDVEPRDTLVRSCHFNDDACKAAQEPPRITWLAATGAILP